MIQGRAQVQNVTLQVGVSSRLGEIPRMLWIQSTCLYFQTPTARKILITLPVILILDTSSVLEKWREAKIPVRQGKIDILKFNLGDQKIFFH